jgi:hypothetical protein
MLPQGAGFGPWMALNLGLHFAQYVLLSLVAIFGWRMAKSRA